MKVFKISILFGLLSVGCGGKEDGKENTPFYDINLVSPSPPPGAYDYMPIVRLKKLDDGTGLGKFKAKNWGTGPFHPAHDCVKFFGPRAAGYDCVSVADKQIEYYFESDKVKSATATATYNFKLNKFSYELHSRAEKDAIAEKLAMEEVKTYCKYKPDDDATWVFIQTATNKLEGKRIYTIFKLKNAPAGDTVKFDGASGAVAGVQMQDSGTLDPADLSTGKTYRTGLPPEEGVEAGEAGGDGPAEGSCEAKVVEINPGEATRGTLACRGLRQADTEKEGEKPQPSLGKYIDFTTNWQCDVYNL